MHSWRVGNVAHGLTRIDIEHNHVRGARDVQPASIRVKREVVPAAFAAELVGLNQVVIGGRLS